MYQVTDGMLDRMAALVARGDEDGLRSYLGHIIARGETLQPLREAMDLKLVAGFHAVAYQVAPWLADEAFGASRRNVIRDALEAAGFAGLSAGSLRATIPGSPAKLAHTLHEMTLAGEIVAVGSKTGGRPTIVYRIAGTLPPQDDPFEWSPPAG